MSKPVKKSIDACPMCKGELTSISQTTINMRSSKGIHQLSKRGECLACNLSLQNYDGEWTTTWLKFDKLKEEIDAKSAKRIYDEEQTNNPEAARNYGDPPEKYKETALYFYNDFIQAKKTGDKLYTWREENRKGLAIARGKFVIKVLLFD